MRARSIISAVLNIARFKGHGTAAQTDCRMETTGWHGCFAHACSWTVKTAKKSKGQSHRTTLRLRWFIGREIHVGHFCGSYRATFTSLSWIINSMSTFHEPLQNPQPMQSKHAQIPRKAADGPRFSRLLRASIQVQRMPAPRRRHPDTVHNSGARSATQGSTARMMMHCDREKLAVNVSIALQSYQCWHNIWWVHVAGCRSQVVSHTDCGILGHLSVCRGLPDCPRQILPVRSAGALSWCMIKY